MEKGHFVFLRQRRGNI